MILRMGNPAKALRWLGFAEAIAWTAGLTSINEIEQANKAVGDI